MRLVDLDPGFVHHDEKGMMLILRCPTCGKHHVGAPVTVTYGQAPPGRWKITSEDFNTLTMEPSVLHCWNDKTPVPDRCPYHFRILNGEIIQC